MGRRWKIAAGVVAGILVLLVLNAIALSSQTKDARTTVDGAEIVDAFGGKMQVTDSGNPAGSTLVLIHGYGGSLRWWDEILPLLEPDHRVIRVDLLGHGGSEKPKSEYSIEDQAEAVASALAAKDVSKATLVGHSLGFTVSVAIAEKSPEVVARLVDIDQSPDNSFGEFPFTAKLADWPLLGPAIYRTTPDFAIKDAVRESAFAPGFNLANGFEDPDQIVEDVNAMTYDSFTKADDADDNFTDETPLDKRLIDLSPALPLLVIFGDEDQLYEPAEEAASAYEDVEGAAISLIPDAGHSPYVEKPQETANLILEFAATPGDAGTPPAQSELTPPNKGTAKKKSAKKDRKKTQQKH